MTALLLFLSLSSTSPHSDPRKQRKKMSEPSTPSAPKPTWAGQDGNEGRALPGRKYFACSPAASPGTPDRGLAQSLLGFQPVRPTPGKNIRLLLTKYGYLKTSEVEELRDAVERIFPTIPKYSGVLNGFFNRMANAAAFLEYHKSLKHSKNGTGSYSAAEKDYRACKRVIKDWTAHEGGGELVERATLTIRNDHLLRNPISDLSKQEVAFPALFSSTNRAPFVDLLEASKGTFDMWAAVDSLEIKIQDFTRILSASSQEVAQLEETYSGLHQSMEHLKRLVSDLCEVVNVQDDLERWLIFAKQNLRRQYLEEALPALTHVKQVLGEITCSLVTVGWDVWTHDGFHESDLIDLIHLQDTRWATIASFSTSMHSDPDQIGGRCLSLILKHFDKGSQTLSQASAWVQQVQQCQEKLSPPSLCSLDIEKITHWAEKLVLASNSLKNLVEEPYHQLHSIVEMTGANPQSNGYVHFKSPKGVNSKELDALVRDDGRSRSTSKF
ncbi:hypothetical protein T439DRAFT_51980 [Meredithblackwellia eburnea MCA 4105]